MQNDRSLFVGATIGRLLGYIVIKRATNGRPYKKF